MEPVFPPEEKATCPCRCSVMKASYPVVLVGCDRREAGLLEHKGFEVFLGVFLAVLAGIHVDHVETRLVAVHGVENDLETAEGSSALM